MLLSRSALMNVCRFLMMSTMLPLPSARMRPTPDSCASVWRSLSPLPAMASAALSMNRAVAVSDTPWLGPNSVANRDQLSLDLIPLHRHSCSVDGDFGAVRHLWPAVLVRRRQLDVACGDEVLGDNDGLGVGGDRHVAIDRKVIRSVCGSGSIDVMVPTFTPATRTWSPGIDGGGAAEVGGDCLGPK